MVSLTGFVLLFYLMPLWTVLLARVLVVYGFTWLSNRITHHVPLQWQHVLAWGGMRGALSLALRGDAFREYTWADVFEDSRLMLTELRELLAPGHPG